MRPSLTLTLALLGCTPDLQDDPIPFVPFPAIVINLNLPEYIALKTDGGYQEISGGVRGIILYRKSSAEYLAWEMNCSFRPNDACATVNVHSSGLYMTDPCCSSNFDFSTGVPTAGPAWRPLQRYATQLSGSTLTVTDQVVF
jgi:nitrite reductase/ring-hydroxylating ferredoxin subunit